MKSNMKYNQINNNNINVTNTNNKISKSNNNTSLSKDKSLKESEKISKIKSKRSSMGDLSGKYKSIENTYFMKDQQ